MWRVDVETKARPFGERRPKLWRSSSGKRRRAWIEEDGKERNHLSPSPSKLCLPKAGVRVCENDKCDSGNWHRNLVWWFFYRLQEKTRIAPSCAEHSIVVAAIRLPKNHQIETNTHILTMLSAQCGRLAQYALSVHGVQTGSWMSRPEDFLALFTGRSVLVSTSQLFPSPLFLNVFSTQDHLSMSMLLSGWHWVQVGLIELVVVQFESRSAPLAIQFAVMFSLRLSIAFDHVLSHVLSMRHRVVLNGSRWQRTRLLGRTSRTTGLVTTGGLVAVMADATFARLAAFAHRILAKQTKHAGNSGRRWGRWVGGYQITRVKTGWNQPKHDGETKVDQEKSKKWKRLVSSQKRVEKKTHEYSNVNWFLLIFI